MEDYLTKLFLSPLPVPLWGVALLWLVAHCVSLVLAGRALKLATADDHIVFPHSAQPQLTRRTVAIQTAFGAGIFAYAQFAGGALAAFFAGGWFLASAVGVAVNMRNVLLQRFRSIPGGVSGKLSISNKVGFMERSADLWAGALWCLVATIVAPHPALLGGAFILGTGAFKLMRGARPALEATTA